MSWRASDTVWQFTDFSSAPEKLALLALADHANDEGGQCFPSIRRLAERTCLSEAQVRRHIHVLIARGLVEVVGNAAGGRPGSSRRYRLKLEVMRASTNATPHVNARDGSHLRGDASHRRSKTSIADASLTVNELPEQSGTARLPPRGWWNSDSGMKTAAEALGIPGAKPGEGRADFKARIEAAIDSIGKGPTHGGRP